MEYIKINNVWEPINEFFKKVNGNWVKLTEVDFLDYALSVTILKQNLGGSISIIGLSNVSAETCSFKTIYNNTLDVTSLSSWSIVSGGTYGTISNGVLSIDPSANNSNITIQSTYNDLTAYKDITVTFKSGSTTDVEINTYTDESGNTVVENTTITTNEDGSSEEHSVTTITDESGNTVGTIESETQTNSDGSFNSSTTNYDENGDAVNSTNESGDTEGNINTQNVEYDESGNSVVVGYEIDTSGSQTGSKDITGDGVNTEFVPFNDTDSGFICHIKFRTVNTEQPNPPLVVDTEDTGSNYLFNILTAKSPFKPYRGFHIRWALKKTNYSSGNLQLGYTAANASSTTSRTIYGVNNIYDINIIYDPLLKIYPSKFRCESNQGQFSTISANITFETNNLDFILGYGINQQDEPYRYSNVQIYEFSITKI